MKEVGREDATISFTHLFEVFSTTTKKDYF